MPRQEMPLKAAMPIQVEGYALLRYARMPLSYAIKIQERYYYEGWY